MLTWRGAAALLAYLLLAAAWVGGSPPFSNPDEEAHYLRAVGLSSGALVGAPVDDLHQPDLTPNQEAIVGEQSRLVPVPAGLAPRGWSCFVARPHVSAACLDEAERSPPPEEMVSFVGTYQPAPYVLPAAATRLGDDPGTANLLGRAAAAAVALALLAAGLLALCHRADEPAGTAGRFRLAGFALAATPMVLATVSALNPSGMEIAGGVALAAGLVRLGRDPLPPRWVWAVVAVGGAALALSRSPGPAWVGLHVGLVLVWVGPARALALVRANGARAAATAAAVVAAVVANRLFEVAYGVASPLSLPRSAGALEGSTEAVGRALYRQAIGVFGYADVPIPGPGHQLWALAAVGLLVLAVGAGRGRDRLALGFAVALVVAATAAIDVLVLRPTGFEVQGRHVLPLAVALPLIAGEVVADRVAALGRTVRSLALAGVGGAVAAVHLGAWYTNARRAAVGLGQGGTWLFPIRAEWAPPGGWVPWLALALAGTALLALALATPPVAAGSRRHRAP